MDVYSYRDHNSDFLIELHTSKSARKEMGEKKIEARSESEIKYIVKMLKDAGENPETINRVIVDKDLNKIKIVDKNNRAVTKNISDLQAKIFLTPIHEASKPQPISEIRAESLILLGSTSKGKESFVGRDFHPITPSEKIWSFFNSIAKYIRSITGQEKKSLGSFDFAVHFFSDEHSRNRLEKEEVKSSFMLESLCTFFQEQGMAAKEIPSIKQAAAWAKKIENVRSENRSTILKEYESISLEMLSCVQKLKDGDSALIPFSCYVDAAGGRVESLRLLRITCTKEALPPRENEYKLEFIDSSDNPAIENIGASKLSLDDFFKPLVDMQLSASFFEEAESGVIESASRFALAHPRFMAWVLMGESPSEERELAVGLVEHAITTGRVTPESLRQKTGLDPKEYAAQIFAPLLQGENPSEFNQELFQAMPKIASPKRMIDNFLPLISNQEQAKIEAQSLFQFYNLYQARLIDDPATMVLMERGLNRVCELHERLHIDDHQTVEMLRVIRTHIDRTKRALHQRSVALDQKVQTPQFAESYAMRVPGEEHVFGGTSRAIKAEASLKVPVRLPKTQDEIALERSASIQDANNLIALDNMNQLMRAAQQIEDQSRLFESLATTYIDEFAAHRNITIENVKIVGEMVSEATSLGLEEVAVELATKGLQEIATRLNEQNITQKQIDELDTKCQAIGYSLLSCIETASKQNESEFATKAAAEKSAMIGRLQEERAKLMPQKDQAKDNIISCLRDLSKPDVIGHIPYSKEDIDPIIKEIQEGHENPITILGRKPFLGYQVSQARDKYREIEQKENQLDQDIRDFNGIMGGKNPSVISSFFDGRKEYYKDIEPTKSYYERKNQLSCFKQSIYGNQYVISNFSEDAIDKTNRSLHNHFTTVETCVTRALDNLVILSLMDEDEKNSLLQQFNNNINRIQGRMNLVPQAEFLEALREIPGLLEPIQEKIRDIQAHEKSYVRFPDVEKRLTALEARITKELSVVSSSKKLSNESQIVLRNEIRAIMEELPIANLGYKESYWSEHPEREKTIIDLQKLLDIAYAGNISHPQYVLESALCTALLFRMNPSPDHAKALVDCEAKITNPYLKYTTPVQQRQFVAIKETIQAHRQTVQDTYSVKVDKLLKNSEASKKASFEVKASYLSPVASISLKSEPLQSNTPSGKVEDYYDPASCVLLKKYLGNEIDGYSTEAAVRQMASEWHELSSDEMYKLLSSNAANSSLGLLELLIQISSPAMAIKLNTTEYEQHLNLQRVIENRLLRPGHLSELLENPDQVSSVLKALTEAIENASKDKPYTYMTLVRTKALVLVFLKEKHRLDQTDTAEKKYSEAFDLLLKDCNKKIENTADPAYKEAQLQLHTTRLNIYAQILSQDPGKKLSFDELTSLIDSWMAFQSSVSTGYKDTQEQEAITQCFYGPVVAAWNQLDDSARGKVLSQVLVNRGQLSKEATPSWSREGEVYTTNVSDDPKKPRKCQIGIISGTCTLSGGALGVAGNTLPQEVWQEFPFYNPACKIPQVTSVPGGGLSTIYEFLVDGLGQNRFQVEVTEKKELLFSIQLPDEKGKLRWFQYTPLETTQEAEARQSKEAKVPEAEEKSEETEPNRLQAFIAAVTEPLNQAKAAARHVGQELAKEMKAPEVSTTVPQDIAKRGIWINKSNNDQAFVLTSEAEPELVVGLSHSKKRGFDGQAALESKFTRVEVVSTTPENRLSLVNNPKSSLYTHLCGITPKQNIKIWADGEGSIQKVELLDPQMTFERDAMTKKLMSVELNGFYISEDQSLPIGDFAADWKNYLILTNDDGDRRMILRQSAILLSSFLTKEGYKRSLAPMNEGPQGTLHPFIDVQLVSHPEKGYILASNTSQANFYLGFAAIQSTNFDSGVSYLRAGARSAPYTGAEQEIFSSLFAYKQEALDNPLPENNGEGVSLNLISLSNMMKQFDPSLAQIAACKLVALATVLEQDLTQQPGLVEALPKDDTVRKWLEIYSLPHLQAGPLESVSAACRMTPDELHRILRRYPNACGRDEQAATLFHEFTGHHVQRLAITPGAPEGTMPSRELAYDLENPLVEELAECDQTSKKESVLTYHADSYIIRHFKELYETIDRLDLGKEADSKELDKIIQKLSRFKDSRPARRQAIDLLLNMAMDKKRLEVPPQAFSQQLERNMFESHIEDLKNNRETLVRSYTNFIRILEAGEGGTSRLMSDKDKAELESYVKELSEIEISSIKGMDNAALRAHGEAVHGQMNTWTGTLSKKLEALLKAQKLIVEGEIVCLGWGESVSVKNGSLYFNEIEFLRTIFKDINEARTEICGWHSFKGFPERKGDQHDTERMAQFLSSHATVQFEEPPVVEKIEAPTESAEELASPKPVSLISGQPFSDLGDAAPDAARKALEDVKQSGTSNGYYTKEVVPFFEKLTDKELVEFDTTLRAMSPEEQQACFQLISDQQFQTMPDLYERFKTGHCTTENIAFFAKLTPDQFKEFCQIVKTIGEPSIVEIINNSKFNTRPNVFELFKDFVVKITNLRDPQDVEQECIALRALIGIKEAEAVSPDAEKETVQLKKKKSFVIKDSKRLEDASTTWAVQQQLETTKSACQKQKQIVNRHRQDILKIVTKLPENPQARNAEELRRLRGVQPTIDIEKVFRAYAQEALPDLKKLNPNLNDDDIKKVRDIVTNHHLDATALQSIERQLENIQTALVLHTRFDTLATKTGENKKFFGSLNGAIKGKDDAKVKKIIEEISLGEVPGLTFETGYTSQRLADDIRDYMAVTKSYNQTATSERFFDPNIDHPHTRAALAYEYTLGVVFREHQINEFIARVGTPDIVSWLGTGFGKTFMAPGLAKMMATGTNLVCVIDTKDLIPTTSKTRDQDSREVYGQAAYHFQFERNPDRPIQDLQEMEYRLLDCIANEGYLVTSKEALGSLVLQLLTWQRLSVDGGKYDDQIAVTQRIVDLFRKRGVALGDEIHLILNVVEALDYAEGDLISMKEFAEYYETTSTIYRAIYPQSHETSGKYAAASLEIAKMLKIAENRQAQINPAVVREAMTKLAALIIDQSLDPEFTPKDELHHTIEKLIQLEELGEFGVSKEMLIQFLTVSEGSEVVECPVAIRVLNEEDKKRIGALKENLSSTFEKTMKKIADDDFGVSSDKEVSICPYNKGRPQPSKELDDIFQTIKVHHAWYAINGIPIGGLKETVRIWQKKLEAELIDYETLVHCPSYKLYRKVFGSEAPELGTLDAEGVEKLAMESKNKPEVGRRFLDNVVFPDRKLFPKKSGFDSMDIVSMVSKFGGYSGTVQTRSSFQRGVSNKDDPNVDSAAQVNFKGIYENPANQDQHCLLDLDSAEMKAEAAKEQKSIPSLSSQLQSGNIDIKKFRAIIDAGGLFKEIDYRDMAKDILAQFSPDELQAVLIYNDKSELMILRRGNNALQPFEPKTVPPDPDKRFTVYRQPQITGADIPQGQRAKALVTINEKTLWGDFEQGVGRMRKNKEGQTYAVVYRQSLIDTVSEDLKIARSKATSPEEREKLPELYKDGKMDVKGLTGRAESEEIKQRRYFAAISEMENMVKQPLRDELLGPEWKEVFRIFESAFFEDSLKSADSLLESKQPTAPTLILNRYKAGLLEGVENKLKADDFARGALEILPMLSSDMIPGTLEQISGLPQDLHQAMLAVLEQPVSESQKMGNIRQLLKGAFLPESTRACLEKAAKELQDYVLPKPEEMPESVMGTDSGATRETEVSKETEAEITAIVTKQKKVESEQMQSMVMGQVDGQWREWYPQNLMGLMQGNKMQAPGQSFQTFSLVQDSAKLFGHLRKGRYTPLTVDCSLFSGMHVTANMTQNRKMQSYGFQFGSETNSLLSEGQKICRSVVEMSVERRGKREHSLLFLDMRDRAVFEKSITHLGEVMTPELKIGIADLAKKYPNITLGELQHKTEFLQLFGDDTKAKSDMKFFVSLLGEGFQAKELNTVSLRINTDGQYTAACGALAIDDSSEESEEFLVRSKIIRGDPVFSFPERKILMNVLSEKYLKVTDNYKTLRADLEKQGLSENKIVEAIAEKQKKDKENGVREYRSLSRLEREELSEKLTDLVNLYQRAVQSSHQGLREMDINTSHLGRIAGQILHNLAELPIV